MNPNTIFDPPLPPTAVVPVVATVREVELKPVSLGDCWIDGPHCADVPISWVRDGERFTQNYSFTASVVRVSDGSIAFTTPLKLGRDSARRAARLFIEVEKGREVEKPLPSRATVVLADELPSMPPLSHERIMEIVKYATKKTADEIRKDKFAVRLLKAIMMNPDEIGEDIDPAELPPLTAEERVAMDSLPPDFIQQIIAGNRYEFSRDGKAVLVTAKTPIHLAILSLNEAACHLMPSPERSNVLHRMCVAKRGLESLLPKSADTCTVRPVEGA